MKLIRLFEDILPESSHSHSKTGVISFNEKFIGEYAKMNNRDENTNMHECIMSKNLINKIETQSCMKMIWIKTKQIANLKFTLKIIFNLKIAV